MEEIKKKENTLASAWASFLTLVVIGGILAVVIIWSWQIYHWLRTGHWQGLSVQTSLDYLGIDLSPLYAPRKWVGIAKLGRWMLPLPMVFEPIIAVVAAVVIAAHTDA